MSGVNFGKTLRPDPVRLSPAWETRLQVKNEGNHFPGLMMKNSMPRIGGQWFLRDKMLY